MVLCAPKGGVPLSYRQCYRCRATLPQAHFHQDSRRCKDCEREYRREWYWNNRDKELERHRRDRITAKHLADKKDRALVALARLYPQDFERIWEELSE